MYCNSQTPSTKRCTKIQVKIFVDILLHLDKYFVAEGIYLSYITFYSTFNTRNRQNIKHYLNTLF